MKKRAEQIKDLLEPKPRGGIIISVNGVYYGTLQSDSMSGLEINVSSERAAQALLNLSK